MSFWRTKEKQPMERVRMRKRVNHRDTALKLWGFTEGGRKEGRVESVGGCLVSSLCWASTNSGNSTCNTFSLRNLWGRKSEGTATWEFLEHQVCIFRYKGRHTWGRTYLVWWQSWEIPQWETRKDRGQFIHAFKFKGVKASRAIMIFTSYTVVVQALRKSLAHLASLREILIEFHWNREERDIRKPSLSITHVQAVTCCKQSGNTGKAHISL